MKGTPDDGAEGRAPRGPAGDVRSGAGSNPHGYGEEAAGAREHPRDGEPWVLYGASGFTGKLLAREAVRRGHRPVLAGRDRRRLEPLARELGLEAREVPLGRREALLELLAPAPLVLHAAGPFVRTAPPMLEACLRTRTHYLDITGEVPVFERIFSLGDVARSEGVLLLPGVGFDVVPTDCLALRLLERLPEARRLELAFRSPGGPSAGTARTMLEHLPAGVLARREGRLVRLPTGAGARTIPFHDRPSRCIPITWGDLSTAYRSTGIPDITTLTAAGIPPRLLRALGPPARLLLGVAPVRWAAQWGIGRYLAGDPRRGGDARASLWGRVEDDAGGEAELGLETLEGYAFTAAAGILAVEAVLGGADTPGARTPGSLLGPDFVDRVPGTRWPDPAGT